MMARSTTPARLDRIRRRAGVIVGVFSLICLALAPRVSAGKDDAEELPSSWYASTFVSGRGGYRIIHYWSSEEKLRAETLIGGHPITTLVNGARYVVFDRLTGKGIEVQRAKPAREEEKGRLRPFANEYTEVVEQGGEKVEETMLFGLEVEVWQITNEQGRRKVWVSKDRKRVPLRIEVFDRGSSESVQTDYSNWSFGLEMPAEFFLPGPQIELERYAYDEFVKKALAGENLGSVPVLYPELLHGRRKP